MLPPTMRLADFVVLNPATMLSKGSAYPFVAMEDVAPGRRYVRSCAQREYSGGGAKFRAGDTLFARITPCLENGKIAQFKADSVSVGFGSTEFIVMRSREGVSDPGYLFYLASTDIVRQPAEKSMSGASGRQRAELSVIQDIEVPAPPLPIQRKIAAILSAYDDLIENNARRIALLEEMARALYREWFVEFRYPGHEGAPLVESPLGLIPQGWRVMPVTEAIWVDPPTKVPSDGEKPFVPMGSLSTSSMVISAIETREGNSGSKFRNDDTLFARITPSIENGKTGFVQFLPTGDSVAFGSTEFIVLRSKSLCPEYVYLLARTNEFRDNAIKSMTGATGRQRVQPSSFERFLIAHPDEHTLSAFHEQAAPLFQLVQTLSERNEQLRRTRDLLLPKLVSGEVDVAGVEIGEDDS